MPTKIEWAEGILAYRFWSNVNIKKPDDCWEWQSGMFSNGYGQFRVGKKKFKAHRFSYLLHNNILPKGKIICHRCDNPKCCNPKHLFAGTHKDNADDRDAKGRGAYKNCKPQPGMKNGSSKLRPNQVLTAIMLMDSGLHTTTIARAFGISNSQARNIKYGRSWKCLQIPR
jgi:hypothetical protein